MFGLGMWEILIILALALIFIGPKKLPDIARTLGKGLKEFRRATNDLRNAANMDIGDPPNMYKPGTDKNWKALPTPESVEAETVPAETDVEPHQEPAPEPDKTGARKEPSDGPAEIKEKTGASENSSPPENGGD